MSLRLSSHHASVEGDATTVRPAVGARDQARQCGALLGLTIISPLSFPLALLDGGTIETIGDAANYLAGLPEEELGQHHWTVAIRMLDHALAEATYLKTGDHLLPDRSCDAWSAGRAVERLTAATSMTSTLRKRVG